MIPVLFSCEHATCAVPEAYRELFRGEEDVLTSGDGWEPGSLNLAQGFSMKFRTPLVHGDVTKLLIDLDATGDDRWSRFSAKLTDAQRVKVADRHERPYHSLLLQRTNEELRRQATVLHVLIHTDAAEEGRIVLEIPADHAASERISAAWRDALRAGAPDLGIDRRLLASPPPVAAVLLAHHGAAYAPVVLRVSRSFFLEGRPWRWEKVKKLLLDTLTTTLAGITPVPESPSCP